MAFEPARLHDELARLRRGRGMHEPDIDQLVGPALGEVCRIGLTDGPAVVRTKVTKWINESVSGFPTDLKLAVTVPLAMHKDAQQALLTHRINWLARRLNRDARTARRRIETGLKRLVEAAQDPAHINPHGGRSNGDWHVVRFGVLARFDGPTPTYSENRTIVANRDGLDHLELSMPAPRTPDGLPGDLDVTVVHGLDLLSAVRSSTKRFVLRFRLPHPLRVGQAHSFALHAQVPPGQAIRPEYVHWPDQRCDQFELTVRFNLRGPSPLAVWRLDDVHHLDFEDAGPTIDELALDELREVTVSFMELRPGRGYGLQWRDT